MPREPEMIAAERALTRGRGIDAATVERVVIHGDLRQLSPAQKVSYYNAVCDAVGLNPITQPFAYLVLNNKEILYAKREATEQLRFIHSVSIDPKNFTREVIEGIYIVTAPASLPSGRTDVSTGAVSIEGLKGEARANAMMKAETKAKRRVTLSICGLGMLDELEVETIPNAIVQAPVAPSSSSASLPMAADAELGTSVPNVPASGDLPADRTPQIERDLPKGAVLVRQVELTPKMKFKARLHTHRVGESFGIYDSKLITRAQELVGCPAYLELKTPASGVDYLVGIETAEQPSESF